MTTTSEAGTSADQNSGQRPAPSLRVLGGPGELLAADQLVEFIADALAAIDVDGKSVCLVVPDATRSCPLPMILRAVRDTLDGRAAAVTVLIALGTHQAMSEEQLARHLGFRAGDSDATYPGWRILNHEFWDEDTFAELGTIEASRIAELTDGLLVDTSVPVRINRHVAQSDVAMVIGPVFPHEVVGFSGGNKYFYPGVSGQELIDMSHWVGALITSAEMIGTPGITPVRALIDEASAKIPAQRLALCLVVASGTDAIHAAAIGTPEQAWSACATVSAETHITYLDHPFRRVLSVMPTKYLDMWTAAKGFYKLEPVVGDGGELIIYAPHITQVSEMHPEIVEIGYHNRHYFLGQWEQFKDRPWGDLAHSTHLRGQGTWTTEDGEKNRVTVTLATGIPEDVVRAINLNYLDPATVDIAEYQADPETFVEPHAGEILYRLRPGMSSVGEPDGREPDRTGIEE
jgi:nickel-dependent lactate racemase